MSPPPTPARPVTRLLVAALLAVALAFVAGCGLRLETPPPAPLVPDVDEQARQRAAADAVALQVLAGSPVPADPADPVAVARAAVAAAAVAHLDLLGGLYDPDGDDAGTGAGAAGPADGATGGSADPDGDVGGAADDPGSPAATPEPDPAVATPDAVVARLVEAAATARSDTSAVQDGSLARLLGSITVGRQLSAAGLAAVAGLPGPPAPVAAVPAVRPEGLSDGDLSALVVAEDAAGYALEVVAAKAGGDTRRLAAESAVRHRSRAQAWAEAGDLAGTGLDPRRVAYALPGGLEDPAAAAALVQSLETTLAANYASLVASVVPGERAAMLDAVAESTAQAVAWGAPLPALPGLPERGGA